MIRRWLCVVGVVTALQANAAMPPEQDVAIGWTKDGTAFVTLLDKTWTVIDARTGRRTSITGLEAFTAWVATHPLVRSEDDGSFAEARGEATTSQDGKTKIDCPGATFGQLWSSAKNAPFSCVSIRDGLSVPMRPRRVTGRLELFWAPGGQRVVLHHTDEQCTPSMGDFACEYVNDFFIERTTGPRVHLAVFGDADDAVKKAVDVLERAGFTPTQVNPAQKARSATVIYAAKGSEADAKRMAAAFPKATVEPLTWKTDADVVVALGK